LVAGRKDSKVMANMFLAGYFASKALKLLLEEEYGTGVLYVGLVILNIVFALT
jgi:hypothetical protein